MTRTTTVRASAQPHRDQGERPRRVRLAAASLPCAKVAAFDRLAQELQTRYSPAEGRALRDLWTALEAARRDLAASGTVSEAQSRQLKDCIARDLEYFGALIARGPQYARERLRRRFARGDGALPALLTVLEKSGDAIYALPQESPAGAERRAGEVTFAGKLSCTHCRLAVFIECSAIVEPCRACGGRAFTRAP